MDLRPWLYHVMPSAFARTRRNAESSLHLQGSEGRSFAVLFFVFPRWRFGFVLFDSRVSVDRDKTPSISHKGMKKKAKKKNEHRISQLGESDVVSLPLFFI